MMEQIIKKSFRMNQRVYNLIIDYASFMGMNFSKALRELILEGIKHRATAKLFSNWQEKVNKRNPIEEIKEGKLQSCDKCGFTEDLQMFHIDGNVDNFTSDNIAIVCKPCLRKLQHYLRKYNPKEKFIYWMFFDEN